MSRPLVIIVVAVTLSCAPAAAPSPSPSATLAPTPASTSAPAARPTEKPSPTPSASPTPTATPTPTRSPAPSARPPGPIHYVALGASDTVGVGSADPAYGSWPSRLAALLPPGSTYKNLGVSGSLASQAISEQLPAAVREQPTLVTIWLAVNDLNAQVPADAYAASLGAIVDALVRDTPARVFVGTVPDLRAVPAYSGVDQAALMSAIGAYNTAVAAIAARHPGRVYAVDLFTGSAGLTNTITVSADGFHPSDEGYALIAQRFAEAMRANGVPLPAAP